MEVVDNWEGCCTGVSEVSDRKREERRFHENEQSNGGDKCNGELRQDRNQPKLFTIEAKYIRAHPSLMVYCTYDRWESDLCASSGPGTT